MFGIGKFFQEAAGMRRRADTKEWGIIRYRLNRSSQTRTGNNPQAQKSFNADTASSEISVIEQKEEPSSGSYRKQSLGDLRADCGADDKQANLSNRVFYTGRDGSIEIDTYEKVLSLGFWRVVAARASYNS